MKYYIVAIRYITEHAEDGDTVYLVGPFDTAVAAGDWGDDEKNNSDDDPRWQVVKLPDHVVHGPLKLVSPST